METILKHYLIAALWATEDGDNGPLDSSHSLTDISQEAREKSLADIRSFLEKAGELVSGISEEALGHDFFLTRNGHGAGFWDREYSPYKEASTPAEREELREASVAKGIALSDAARACGGADFYVGDDGKIYC